MKVIILLLLLLLCPALLSAQTLPDCEEATVQAAHDNATNGDTITCPPGTYTWESVVTFSKAITFQGQGIGQTIIEDAITGTGAMLQWNCVTGWAHRITGFEFTDGGRGTLSPNGALRLDCTNIDDTTFRVDHNRFDNLNASAIRFRRTVGVVDHNEFVTTANRMASYVYDDSWNEDGTYLYGDQSWADTVTWGGPQFLFFEDNTLTQDSCIDGNGGMRGVFRFNTFTNCHVTVHGTESAGRDRGGVAIEVYKNVYDGDNDENVLTNLRSGAALIWGNPATDLGANPRVGSLTQDRMTAVFNVWLGADGTSEWDINDENNPLAQETATSGSGLTVTVSGAGWTPGEHIGRTIVKTSGCTPSPPSAGRVNCHSVITGNTSDTITFQASGFGSSISFTNADTFDINKVIEVLDGIGRTGGTELSGATPTPPVDWNNQTYLPVYEWLNTNNDVVINNSIHPSCTGTCIENVHYYNYTESFDGTVGVGSGARSARPVTCTTGVAYWSTDQGAWNSSGSGGQGVLDYCSSTNTWTDAWYTPYTYPHPLQGAVQISAIDPAFGVQNTADTYNITGVGFEGEDSGATTSVTTICAGITPGSPTVNSNIDLDVVLTIASDATVGSCSITVTVNSGADESNAVAFDVIVSGGPTLTSISPNQGYRGSTVPVTFTGTGFDGGNAAIAESCSGIAFTGLNVESATSITANAVIDSDASLGTCNVEIATDAGTSNANPFQSLSAGGGSGILILLRRGGGLNYEE